ncbi:TPA: hypothetical protein ACH7YI_005173, partial [Escherichia coli]
NKTHQKKEEKMLPCIFILSGHGLSPATDQRHIPAATLNRSEIPCNIIITGPAEGPLYGR